MKEVLVTGGHGQLGTTLARAAWPDGYRVVALGRDALDLTSTAAIAATVAERRWAAVVNAGAYTAVDAAEDDAVAAWAVNALAPAALAAATRAADIPLVQVSTDYVFSGDKPGPYEVGDPPRPLGVYGASKLGGEWAVATGNPRHAVVRIAWLVSPHGRNFVTTMLRLGADRPSLRVVDDQHGSPTSAADLAAALATIAVRLAEDPAAPTGTYHFSNAGAVSRAGFAREIFAQARGRGGPSPDVEDIATADHPTPARRPASSLLGHAAIARDYGIRPRPWQAALSDILDELLGDGR